MKKKRERERDLKHRKKITKGRDESQGGEMEGNSVGFQKIELGAN